MSDIERQIKLEADARYEGMLRFAKNREYRLATDLKPVRDLLANSLESLWKAILQHQMELKTPQYKKLTSPARDPRYPSGAGITVFLCMKDRSSVFQEENV